MPNEAAQGEPQEALQKAIQTAAQYDANFTQDARLLPQHLAWKIYWYGVALHAWERANNSTQDDYMKRATKMLEIWK